MWEDGVKVVRHKRAEFELALAKELLRTIFDELSMELKYEKLCDEVHEFLGEGERYE